MICYPKVLHLRSHLWWKWTWKMNRQKMPRHQTKYLSLSLSLPPPLSLPPLPPSLWQSELKVNSCFLWCACKNVCPPPNKQTKTKTNCTENMHNNIFLHGHFNMCIINIHSFISTHTSSSSRFRDKKSIAPVSRANRPQGTQFWVLHLKSCIVTVRLEPSSASMIHHLFPFPGVFPSPTQLQPLQSVNHMNQYQ